MFSTARLALTLMIGLAPFAPPSTTAPEAPVAPLLSLDPFAPPSTTAPEAPVAPLLSLDPSISFVGGTAEARKTVTDAVTQFTAQELALPDLEIRFHADPSGCGGHHGLFHHNHGEPAIDLCYDREFLALHEIGHAWEHFNLDDATRHDFQEFTATSNWNAAHVPHDDRAIEIAADALAHGLLSTPLTEGMHRDREFEQFEALTGSATPRLDPAG